MNGDFAREESSPPAGRVLSVNVGAIRHLELRGQHVSTAIWKHPVDGRVAIRGVNLEGDDQADRTVHGGPDKAVYSYAHEDYDWWRGRETFDMRPGLFGENLTTEGLDLSSAVVGERWSIGSAVLEVAQPRLPCFKLGIRVGDPHFLKRFFAALRMGAYLRVVREGDVGAGDRVTVLSRPDHGITLREMTRALREPEQAVRLRDLQYLPEFWRRVAEDA
jgi:MOSC domain-containing protein YiiM